MNITFVLVAIAVFTIQSFDARPMGTHYYQRKPNITFKIIINLLHYSFLVFSLFS